MSERGFDDLRGSGAFRSIGGAEDDPTPGPTPPRTELDQSEMAPVGPPRAEPRAAAMEAVVPRTEIEQTRAELSETIEAIQDRLAPPGSAGTGTDMVADATERSLALAREIVEQTVQEASKQAKLAVVDLSSQAKASVRAATVGRVERIVTSTGEKAKQAADSGSNKAKQAASSGGETAKGLGSTVVTTIRQNPWPAAMTALGIGWLVSSGTGGTNGGTSRSTEHGSSSGNGSMGDIDDGGASAVDRAKEATGQAVDQVTETTRQSVDQAQETVGAAVDTVSETAGDVAGTVGSALGSTASTVGSAIGSTTSAVGAALGSTASTVKSGATGLASEVQQQAQRVGGLAAESPLKVGATTLALGGALGFALPVSRRETALIGDSRDKAVDRLEQTVQETLTKLQNVASEAQDAAAKEAKYQGLAPEAG